MPRYSVSGPGARLCTDARTGRRLGGWRSFRIISTRCGRRRRSRHFTWRPGGGARLPEYRAANTPAVPGLRFARAGGDAAAQHNSVRRAGTAGPVPHLGEAWSRGPCRAPPGLCVDPPPRCPSGGDLIDLAPPLRRFPSRRRTSAAPLNRLIMAGFTHADDRHAELPDGDGPGARPAVVQCLPQRAPVFFGEHLRAVVATTRSALPCSTTKGRWVTVSAGAASARALGMSSCSRRRDYYLQSGRFPAGADPRRCTSGVSSGRIRKVVRYGQRCDQSAARGDSGEMVTGPPLWPQNLTADLRAWMTGLRVPGVPGHRGRAIAA